MIHTFRNNSELDRPTRLIHKREKENYSMITTDVNKTVFKKLYKNYKAININLYNLNKRYKMIVAQTAANVSVVFHFPSKSSSSLTEFKACQLFTVQILRTRVLSHFADSFSLKVRLIKNIFIKIVL
jgi:hypothetical protein